MKAIYTIAAITALLIGVSACTQHDIYDNIAFNQKNECEKLTGTQKETCMQQLAPDYEVYELERQKLLKK
jgi:hypothetical protein